MSDSNFRLSMERQLLTVNKNLCCLVDKIDAQSSQTSTGDSSGQNFKTRCFLQPESTNTITGTDAAPWILIAGDIELTRAGGDQAGNGGFQNAFGEIEYSRDGGATFGTFSQILGGGQSQTGVPLVIRNTVTGTEVPIVLQVFVGGGSPTYEGLSIQVTPEVRFECQISSDGSIVCCDESGQEVPFNNSWEAVPCVTDVNLTNEGPFTVENLNDIRIKECFEKDSAIVDTLRETPVSGASAPASEKINIFPNTPTEVTGIIIQIENAGFAEIPFEVEITSPDFPPQIVTITPLVSGFTDNVLTSAVWPYRLNLTSPLPATDELCLQGVNPAGGAVDTNANWDGSNVNDNVQFDSLSSGGFPILSLLTGGVDKFCRKTTFGGETIITNSVGDEISSLPTGVQEVPCDSCEYCGPSAIDIGQATAERIVIPTPPTAEAIAEAIADNPQSAQPIFKEECFVDDTDPENFRTLVKVLSFTDPLAPTVQGYLEDDLVTVADITGWTKTDDCNCCNC